MNPRIPEEENGCAFKDWLDRVDADITIEGRVIVTILCLGGEWVPVYDFPSGLCDSPAGAYYDSLEDAVCMTTSTHIEGAKTNRSIQMIGKIDIENITEKTGIILEIKEELH